MDVTSLNVSLPKALKEYIKGQIAGGAYSTPSEYVRELIREDQKRRAQEKLEAALWKGLHSGPPLEIKRGYWAGKRGKLRERHKRVKAVG